MRKQAAVWLVAMGALALPAAAQAHVSLHPNTLPAGSFPTIDIRVPNEEENANTTKLAVQFPPGFLDVSTGYLPGWSVKVLKQKLAKPIKTDEGTVTEQIREVIWSGGRFPPETFLDFPISTSVPDDAAGKALTFKAVQTYDSGKVVRWIGPPSANDPAPTVNVTANGGVLQDVAGTETGPGSPPGAAQPAGSATKATTSSSRGASKGLGISALVVAIVALLIALGALAMRRRPQAGAAQP
jgi:uncharacterized protein YcnI